MQSKTHIDRLGDKLRFGKIDAEVLTELEAYRSSFGDAYSHVCARLEALNYEVTGRPAKSTGAIIDKLKRLPSRLSQMQDIAGAELLWKTSSSSVGPCWQWKPIWMTLKYSIVD